MKHKDELMACVKSTMIKKAGEIPDKENLDNDNNTKAPIPNPPDFPINCKGKAKEKQRYLALLVRWCILQEFGKEAKLAWGREIKVK